MILKGWAIQFRGTIKGISPERAKRMFRYDMHPDAKGITFRGRGKKTEIISYFPEKYVSKGSGKSPGFISSKNAMTQLIKIASQIRKTNIGLLWNNLAGKDYYSGHHMFMSLNHKLFPTGIENILFTLGNLPTPKPHTIELKNSSLNFRLQNSKPDYQLGIIFLDTETLQMEHTPPAQYTEIISLPLKRKNSMIFLYYKHNKNFSPSICISPSLTK
jgi:hypothetical protein